MFRELYKSKGIEDHTADELIDIINKFLKSHDSQTFSKRTLRFYISQGIVPPPSGPAKYARYGYHHFLTAVAARILQKQGCKLDQVQTKIVSFGPFDCAQLEQLIQSALEIRAPGNVIVRELESNYLTKKNNHPVIIGQTLQRVPTSESTMLLITNTANIREELTQAKETIDSLLEMLDEEQRASG